MFCTVTLVGIVGDTFEGFETVDQIVQSVTDDGDWMYMTGPTASRAVNDNTGPSEPAEGSGRVYFITAVVLLLLNFGNVEWEMNTSGWSNTLKCLL